MSAGFFLKAFYSLDNGNVANIRIQPESAALVLNGVTNTIPAGPAVESASVKVNGSRRAFGVNARKVRLEWTGAAPDGYDPDGIVTVPWFNPTTFAGIVRAQTGTYLGSGVRVLGKTPEYIN